MLRQYSLHRLRIMRLISEYEILNYNAPETSYASNPSDCKTVIKECKEMIQALHSAGFSVVMEMPYTHASEENSLEKSVPGLFLQNK